MAGGMDLGTSTKGGRKSLDAALNLVPFIDLMAVTIAFFIQAGTWTQLGALQVPTTGQSVAEPSDAPPLVPVRLRVTERTLRLTVGSELLEPMPVVRNEYGKLQLKPLRLALAQLKQARPLEGTITLETEDAVLYDDLVRIIDQCVGSKFPSVSVMPVAVAN